MAAKTKQELKQVFNEVCDLYYQKAEVDLSKETIEITPEFNLPVTTDTLQITQDDPTINHYKVIGLDADWTSTSSPGDMKIQLTVPTINKEVMQIFYGDNSVADITKATVTTGDTEVDNEAGYEGYALEPKKKKIQGTFVLVDAEKNNLFIVTNFALYAKFLYDNVGTDPFAIQLIGSIEGAGKKCFAFLKKKQRSGDAGAGSQSSEIEDK